MKLLLPLLAGLLLLGAGCVQESPRDNTTPASTSTTEQPTTADFDTNDYLDAALDELEVVDKP